MRAGAVVVVAWLAGACRGFLIPADPRPLAGVQDSAEYVAFAGTGDQELWGQALLTTRAGEVRLAAGRLVTLDPATTYARRWFRSAGTEVERFQVPGPHGRFAAARRLTVADAEGRFWFGRLQPGSYVVRTAVTWQDAADSVVQGGVVAGLVTVGPDDEEPELILHQLVTADSAALLVVAIVNDAELLARSHRSIGRVSGSSCEMEWEAPARKRLVLEAGRRGADAVGRVVWRKRGPSLGGCLRNLVCEGEGLVWM